MLCSPSDPVSRGDALNSTDAIGSPPVNLQPRLTELLRHSQQPASASLAFSARSCSDGPGATERSPRQRRVAVCREENSVAYETTNVWTANDIIYVRPISSQTLLRLSVSEWDSRWSVRAWVYNESDHAANGRNCVGAGVWSWNEGESWTAYYVSSRKSKFGVSDENHDSILTHSLFIQYSLRNRPWNDNAGCTNVDISPQSVSVRITLRITSGPHRLQMPTYACGQPVPVACLCLGQRLSPGTDPLQLLVDACGTVCLYLCDIGRLFGHLKNNWRLLNLEEHMIDIFC